MAICIHSPDWKVCLRQGKHLAFLRCLQQRAWGSLTVCLCVHICVKPRGFTGCEESCYSSILKSTVATLSLQSSKSQHKPEWQHRRDRSEPASELLWIWQPTVWGGGGGGGLFRRVKRNFYDKCIKNESVESTGLKCVGGSSLFLNCSRLN